MSDMTNRNRWTSFAAMASVAVFMLVPAEWANAQTPPATIPVVVAQAMSIESSMFGQPHYFDSQTPPDWPSELVPPGARVVGGGTIGNASMFRMRAAVFDFPTTSKADEVLRALLTRAGYTPAKSALRSGGGFAETETPRTPKLYCKGRHGVIRVIQRRGFDTGSHLRHLSCRRRNRPPDLRAAP